MKLHPAVGSGSAGSPVGARLSENPAWEVLVLEAGGQPPPVSYIPGLSNFGIVWGNPYNYHYMSTPQKFSHYNFRNKEVPFHRGKVIGGSSVINYLFYNRGSRSDYDRWAALGNTGWDYETVLKYYRKMEDYNGNFFNERYHGKGGPLSIESTVIKTPLTEAFFKAGEELGLQRVDYNAEKHIGYNLPEMNTRNRERQSSADAFLKPNLERPNLKLQSESRVIKVLLDDDLRAVGVKYIHQNQIKQVFARKEVILSAGAFDSPKLLMLSGIGPKKHLEQHGIRCRVDLPGVGQNAQDHLRIYGLSWTMRPTNTNVLEVFSREQSKLYREFRNGSLSGPSATVGHYLMNLGGNPDPGTPDVQFLVTTALLSGDRGFITPVAFGLRRDVYQDYFQPYEGQEGFSIFPLANSPKSRGYVALRSSNPLDPPVIEPKFLVHSDDVEVLVKAAKVALRICETPAFAEGAGAKFIDRPLPGCKHLATGSDEYWRCYVRSMSTSAWHNVGTCKMSPASDPMGVVSPSLKVRGVKGLRVIDASIMPYITTGNTNAPTIMIGERGVDFIKEEYGFKK
ncbi:Glucose-methanol-choline oxidoreductase N-terminal [Trinorchestia longiramus]|nr:Glucose-methanol-choline oxidoreductase N-terminal [Trinorchestia longiramus]